MFEKCSAVLKMTSVFLEDEPLDRTEYTCTVSRYDEEGERIYLVMNGEDITRISLDAEYSCTLWLKRSWYAGESKGKIS